MRIITRRVGGAQKGFYKTEMDGKKFAISDEQQQQGQRTETFGGCSDDKGTNRTVSSIISGCSYMLLGVSRFKQEVRGTNQQEPEGLSLFFMRVANNRTILVRIV